jgi:hypothetical protein
MPAQVRANPPRQIIAGHSNYRDVKLRVQHKDGHPETLEVTSVSIVEGADLDWVGSDGTQYFLTKDGYYDGWGKGVAEKKETHRKNKS